MKRSLAKLLLGFIASIAFVLTSATLTATTAQAQDKPAAEAKPMAKPAAKKVKVKKSKKAVKAPAAAAAPAAAPAATAAPAAAMTPVQKVDAAMAACNTGNAAKKELCKSKARFKNCKGLTETVEACKAPKANNA